MRRPLEAHRAHRALAGVVATLAWLAGLLSPALVQPARAAPLPVGATGAAAGHVVGAGGPVAPGPLSSALHRVPLSAGRPLPGTWPRPRPLVAAPAQAPKPTVPLESTNWSGFVASRAGARFTGVTGAWTVPTVQPGPAGYSSSWVGIDGATNQTLVQAGTEQDWSPDGVVYYAWYELIPSASIYLGQVFPGDRIVVDIAMAGPSTWKVTVYDSTSGTVWSGAVSYSTPGSSAEWVEEAPSSGTSLKLFPLANFGSVAFSDLAVTGPGTAQATLAPIYMVTKGHGPVRAYPSPYDPSTNSFGVTYGTRPAATYPGVRLSGGPSAPPAPAPPPPAGYGPSLVGPGYWLAGLDGGVYAYGSARYHGSVAGLGLGRGQSAVTGISPTPDGGGYWLVTLSGGVFPLGDAPYYGSLVSLGGQPEPIVGLASTPDGRGYYMVGVSGGVYAFGDAHYAGGCSTAACGQTSTVAIVANRTGKGYWLVQSDCRVVAFGGAPALSSATCQAATGAERSPARAAAAAPGGDGLWVVLQNGSLYPLGSATALGAWPGTARPVSTAPAAALVPTADGRGGWLVLANGSVEPLGDAKSLGDLGGHRLNAAVFAASGA